MFGFFKAKPVNAPATTGIIGMTTRPLLINPNYDEDTNQKLYRLNAIERYTQQRKEEGRPIPPQRMQELEDDYTILTIELRKRGVLD